MRERKTDETDELLVVHKAAKAADPGKSGRSRGPGDVKPRSIPALDNQELEVMKKRFVAAKDEGEKRRLLAEIQHKFGNEKAAALVKDTRREDEDLPLKTGPKRSEKNKR